ncbi:MAG: hypothetical protein ACAI38_20750 [Myxococcota bacterium]
MSATHGLGRQNAIHSSAELVSQQIQGVSQQIQGLGKELEGLGQAIQNLVNELQSLKPPAAPGAGADDAAIAAYQDAMNRYNDQVNKIRGRIDELNNRSQQIANKIGELQDKIRRLENSDMPAAVRRDAERQEAELKMAREKYESIAKVTEASQNKLDADEAAKRESTKKQMRVGGNTQTSDTTASTDQRLSLRVQWRNSEVRVSDTSDLKTIVRAFTMVLGTVGDGSDFARRANPAIAMPYSPGTGLPPVNTP